MGQYNNPDFLFTFERPAVPSLAPVSNSMKIWEIEEDNAYLNYLYPKVTQKLQEISSEYCDRMEYEGSLMYDAYPDKLSLQRIATRILDTYKNENETDSACDHDMLQNMAETVLYQEIMFRRNRYRNRRRLYY